jgi:hypothetical protein
MEQKKYHLYEEQIMYGARNKLKRLWNENIISMRNRDVGGKEQIKMVMEQKLSYICGTDM